MSVLAVVVLSASVLLAPAPATAVPAEYSVVDYGARPDGRTDAAGAFLAAWAAACGDGRARGAVMRVPVGRYLVSQAYFGGPCRGAGGVVLAFDGAVVLAPPSVGNTSWIMFHRADGLAIRGGTLDGQGQDYWACRRAARRCPPAATTLVISQCKGVSVKWLTLLNSKGRHMSIYGCAAVTLWGVRIAAPADSPNTDGIDVSHSSVVSILGATIGTGDDCVAMGPGTSDVLIRNIQCGPGHGISIGSLGKEAVEEGVRAVRVESVALTGTQNGLRIKTWGRPGGGYVTGVSFSGVSMRDVMNPIVIDQNYCPHSVGCPGQSSGVKISGVEYTGVKGTSATPVAVRFDCSGSNPCSGISLRDVGLTYQGKPAQSFCKNAHGSASGVVSPPSCLEEQFHRSHLRWL